MDEFAVLARRLYRETHFFFFFFLMISAWVLKACQRAHLVGDIRVGRVHRDRFAVAACCRIALAIFIGGNFLIFAWFPLQREAVAIAAACSDFRSRPANVAVQRGSDPSDQRPL
jgi:uncharacterized membrane protein